MSKEVKTLSTLVKMVKAEILKDNTVEEMQEYSLVELVSNETYNIVADFAKNNCDVTDKQYRIMTCSNYGGYSYCSNREELIREILITVIEYQITDTKKTFKQVVKESIENSIS